MKVVCVENKRCGETLQLTIGKIYKVTGVGEKCIRVFNDFGYDIYYDYCYFMDIDEYRDKQIERILNEV